MKDERRYTIDIDTAYQYADVVWWILEVDMSSAVHIGLGIYHATVASPPYTSSKTKYVYPMTREQVYEFIRRRLGTDDWVDIVYLDGTRLRNLENTIRSAYLKGSVTL